MNIFLSLLMTVIFLWTGDAFAHGGGLDSSGCHHNRKAGDYHCHRGSLAGQSFSSKSEAQNALGGSVTRSRPQRSSSPDGVTGRASVIDGDTIVIHGQRIRFHGIDAPEGRQSCQDGAGASYRCGQKASFALADKIGQQPVRCTRKDTDRYGRMVAVCWLGTVDLNAWMVAEGWAVAYRRFSRDYVPQENKASGLKIGIWQGKFIVPSDWRRGKRLKSMMTQPRASESPKKQQSTTCRIKGNISRSGRIYHVPGGQYYSRTKISPSKGERWFCSEAEARAAGWRRSKR